MNIQSVGRLMVLAKNEREGSNRQMYYNLAVLTDGQAGNISCTPEAYDKAVINTENDVVFAFNDQYKSFRVVDIIPAPYIPDDVPDTKPDEKTDNTPDTKPDEKTDNTPDTKPDSKTDKPGNKPDGRAAK